MHTEKMHKPLRLFKILKIDLYILGEVLGPFFGGIIFFLFVFLMFQVLRIAEIFIVHGTSGILLFKMVLLLMVSFMPFVLPVAFLIAILVGFGRLSSDSELVALKASGIGIFRLSAPLIFLSIGVVILNLFLNLEWVPWSETVSKDILVRVGNTKVISSIKEGTFTSGFFDLLLFADKVDPKTNQMKHVFIYDEREPKNPLTVVAESGEILPVKTSSDLGASIVLMLHNGSIHRNEVTETTYQKIDFKNYQLYLKIDEGAPNSIVKPQMIPYHDLLKRISESDPKTYYGSEMRGEYWRRIAIAIAPLIFVFLGIGFGSVRTRAIRASATLVAFCILFLYWSLLSASTIAVQRGLLPPWFSMEIPNIAICILAIFGFKKAAW